jgi:hypothetical protein
MTLAAGSHLRPRDVPAPVGAGETVDVYQRLNPSLSKSRERS